MSRKVRFVVVGVAGAAALALPVSAPSRTLARDTTRAVLDGRLGFDGGAYPPGFHPTAGTVEIEFVGQTIVIEHPVGPSGRFRLQLNPGQYSLVGCGPSTSGGSPLCGQPEQVTLTAGEVDHVKVVWAYTP